MNIFSDAEIEQLILAICHYELICMDDIKLAACLPELKSLREKVEKLNEEHRTCHIGIPEPIK